MEHNTRSGAPRLLDVCNLPLTAVKCVRRIYTDVAVVEVTPDGFLVREVIEGLDRGALQARSGAPLKFADDCRPLRTPALADRE
jgi:3-oxoadipate CoA-transferase beta subunit